MFDLFSILTFLILSTIIGLVIWGNLPARRSSPEVKDDTPTTIGHETMNRDVGLLTGMSDGDISDASVARYALGRSESDHGRDPTIYEVGLVIGLTQTVEPPNVENP